MDAGEESLKALEVQLQILVITYNRAAFLQKTFEQFEASPFAGCAITVLDNCSSDDTPRVCERFRSRFRSLEIIRHPKNIGASANYLRAVETAKATYTWIVCDDDRLDLHAAQDVVLKLREGKVDLVHLGLLGNYGWTRGAESKSNELALAASHYFFVLSFLPDLIFRTELFNSQHLTAGYRNIFNLYPHFPFLAETAARAYSIYVSNERIVYRGEEQNYLSGFTWYKLWVNSCQLIQSPLLRRKAMYDIHGVSDRDRLRWLRTLCACIVEEKIGAIPTVKLSALDLFRGMRGEQLLLLSCLLPFLFAPRAVFPFLSRLHKRIRGKPIAPTGPPGPAFDPLRL